MARRTGRPDDDDGGHPMDRLPDDREVELLDEAECLRLLTTAAIGRVAFTEGALPAVQPVSFAVADGEIDHPRAPREQGRRGQPGRGGRLRGRRGRRRRADRLERDRGRALAVITDAARPRRLDGLGVRSWAPGRDAATSACGSGGPAARRDATGLPPAPPAGESPKGVAAGRGAIVRWVSTADRAGGPRDSRWTACGSPNSSTRSRSGFRPWPARRPGCRTCWTRSSASPATSTWTPRCSRSSRRPPGWSTREYGALGVARPGGRARRLPHRGHH